MKFSKHIILLLVPFGLVLSSICAFALPVAAEKVRVDVSTNSAYILSDRTQTIPVRVGLTGFDIPSRGERTPVNVSIVLDRSGSMSGDKIARAKEAAVMAINRLRADDIVSVVTYDHNVNVVVPATKLNDRYDIIRRIEKIRVGGNTALFAGVSKGAAEVRKFFDRNRVNRIILLSDGLANVGPSSPGELGDLGRSLGRDGISVSTFGLGLGFNEDLMTRLALNSDGNHAFVESAIDLARVFEREFGDILSVAAQDVEVTITCGNGIRPVRIIGRAGEIHGNRVTLAMNQLYSNQEKFVMLEVEVPATSDGRALELADVEVAYRNMQSKKNERIAKTLGIQATSSRAKVDKTLNKGTVEDYYKQLANDASEKAIEFRDAGKKEEAKKVLTDNAMLLRQKGSRYGIGALNEAAADYDEEAKSLDKTPWAKQRKMIKGKQYQGKTQQSFSGSFAK